MSQYGIETGRSASGKRAYSISVPRTAGIGASLPLDAGATNDEVAPHLPFAIPGGVGLNWVESDPWPHRGRADGRVPWGGVGAVGKWPAAATTTSLAAGHLSTAVVIADLR
jgi:hypothetical protein